MGVRGGAARGAARGGRYAGRFVYIDRVKGNPGFLVSIPASLRLAKCARPWRAGDLAELREVLARHLPELGG